MAYVGLLNGVVYKYVQATTLAAGMVPKASGISVGPVQNLTEPVEILIDY